MDRVAGVALHRGRGLLLVMSLLILIGCTSPPPARPQAPSVSRIGVLGWSGRSPSTDAFVDGLRELGWVEGQNLAIEWRFAEGNTGRLPALARELVSLKPHALFASGEAAAQTFLEAGTEIPIVMAT